MQQDPLDTIKRHKSLTEQSIENVLAISNTLGIFLEELKHDGRTFQQPINQQIVLHAVQVNDLEICLLQLMGHL